MDKVVYQIEVSKETHERIQKCVSALNWEISNHEDPVTSEEDVIKGAIWEFLSMFEAASGADSIMSILMDAKHKNYQIRNRFKDILKEKKMKQVDLVKLTDISKTNLSQILNNKYTPGLDSFFRIWAALEFPQLTDCIYIEYMD